MGDSKVLLDAGLSLKATKKGLKDIGVRLSGIDYILISHSHGDHIDGVPSIVKNYSTKVICSKSTALTLDIEYIYISTIEDEELLSFGNFSVLAKSVPHDAHGSLAFSITNSMGEKLLYLTDCGKSDYMIFEPHNFYIIEANYDNEKLTKNLKDNLIHFAVARRTSSGTGHLEINQTIEILKNSVGDRLGQIVLSHLSDKNGDGDKFTSMVKKSLNFDRVCVAEPGLSVNYGENPKEF
jgi:phosphoribosyl 1,2-cyclic phosphodiesterase